MSPETTARPRRAAAATRRRLLEAGRRAFAQKGLAGANLKEDILEPACVSVGSFYHQFEDKTDLLLAILREHSERFRALLAEVHAPRPGRSLPELVRASYQMVFELAERNEDLLRIELRERFCGDRRVHRFLRESRERWIESLASDYARIAAASGIALDASLLATLIVGLARGTLAQYLERPRSERPLERDRLLEGLVRFTLGGAPAFTEEHQP